MSNVSRQNASASASQAPTPIPDPVSAAIIVPEVNPASLPQVCKNTHVPVTHPRRGPELPQLAGPAKDISWDDHPYKSFSLFITEGDWKLITKNSNLYQVCKGAGAADYYTNMQPFSVAEIKAGHGILVDNGISPSPRVQYKFQDPVKSPWGSARIKRAWPKGQRRWQEFRSFLHIAHPLKEGDTKLRKIEPLHSHIRDRCETCVEPGQKMAFDEATCGFQGRDSDTLQHKDKAEGQGWQADMLGPHGYPWTWFWRHEKVPTVLPGFTVLWQRCFWMFRRLKIRYPLNDHYDTTADNLFISKNFLSAAKEPPIPELPHIYINGTARSNYANFPACIKFASDNSKLETLETRLAVSTDGVCCYAIYDKKAVYFMGTSWPKFTKFATKTYNKWDSAEQMVRVITKWRTSIQQQYNFEMNAVDVIDQVMNVYRPDHSWWQNQKPWWALWIWCLRIALCAGYKVHVLACRDAKKRPISHLMYHKMVSDWLLGVGVNKKKRIRSQSHPCIEPIPTEPANISEAVDALRALPCTVIETEFDLTILTEQSIRHVPRLDGTFHPITTQVSNRQMKRECQWCRFKYDKLNIRHENAKRQVRAHLKCDTCRILFCTPECYTEFHTKEGLPWDK